MAKASEVVLAGLPSEVVGMCRRHVGATIVPAALLGACADALILVGHDLGYQIALGILLGVAFELYVGYAELIVVADRAGERQPASVFLRGALPLTPPLVAASLIAVVVPLAASGLLVLPGLWLLTVWSLFAPAIVHERLSPLRSLSRSARLVRGAFWPVAFSVTLMVLLEHTAIHATAHVAEPALGSEALGLLAAAVATGVVSGPAAFTISLVYERLVGAHGEHPRQAAPEPQTVA
jgi:hypothetical protein